VWLALPSGHPVDGLPTRPSVSNASSPSTAYHSIYTRSGFCASRYRIVAGQIDLQALLVGETDIDEEERHVDHVAGRMQTALHAVKTGFGVLR
jgi:hypothetical protein